MISLHPLTPDDAKKVLRFERENRAFFERVIPGRGDAYYDLTAVHASIERSIAARLAGTDFMYVIRDADGEVVGRINLADTREEPVRTAELGYRIGARHSGEGYATRAVGLLLEEAFGLLGMMRLEAVTTPTNVGSQIVLLRNGFAYVARTPRALELNGVWHDNVRFERMAERHRSGSPLP